MEVADQPVQTNVVVDGDRTWCQDWTPADLQSWQVADPARKQIVSWKQTQTTQPTLQKVQGASRAMKRMRAQWNWLLGQKDVLRRRWKTAVGHVVRLQILLPRSLIAR